MKIWLIPLILLGAWLLNQVVRRVLAWRNGRRYPDYRVQEFPAFLSDEECLHLIRRAQLKIGESTVLKKGKTGQKAFVRASGTAFLEDRNDPVLKTIKKKLASLSGLHVNRQEKTQVTHYDSFGYYSNHYDSVGKQKHGGDRTCTVIIYLNDDFIGGGTLFPRLGKRVKAEKGKAVLFHNLTEDGSAPHPLALHAGEVVWKGEKWLCNQWIRESKHR